MTYRPDELNRDANGQSDIERSIIDSVRFSRCYKCAQMIEFLLAELSYLRDQRNRGNWCNHLVEVRKAELLKLQIQIEELEHRYVKELDE